ncbi:hypothetical protein COOONC_13291 [Cooperia oncophora]
MIMGFTFCEGLALPALAAVQVKVRTLVLNKSITGDFGFSIRRVQFPSNRHGGLRTIVFAEPSNVQTGPPRPDDLKLVDFFCAFA